MKFTGEKLRKLLLEQREAVSFVGVDGVERYAISPRYVAAALRGASFTGFGKNGLVVRVVADSAPRRPAFVTKADMAAVMAAFPRHARVHRNLQEVGGALWKTQPSFSGTGRVGKLVAVFLNADQASQK